MGYYIQGPVHGKAKYICEQHGGEIICPEDVERDFPTEYAVICVVDNGPFEAAGYCFNKKEFEAFYNPQDTRSKTWIKMDLKSAQTLSGYPSLN